MEFSDEAIDPILNVVTFFQRYQIQFYKIHDEKHTQKFVEENNNDKNKNKKKCFKLCRVCNKAFTEQGIKSHESYCQILDCIKREQIIKEEESKNKDKDYENEYGQYFIYNSALDEIADNIIKKC